MRIAFEEYLWAAQEGLHNDSNYVKKKSYERYEEELAMANNELIQTKIKKDSFLRKFEATKGNVSISAKEANISRSTYYEWIKKEGEYYDAEFAEKASEIIEGTGDFVESKLMTRISKNDITAIIFYCKTKLKTRGYIERSEYTGKDDAPLHPTQTVLVTKATVKAMVEEISGEF